MDFTSPYVTLPVVMATTMDKPFTENIASLTDKKLGVVEGYAIGEKLKSQFPDLQIVEVKSITDGLKGVESGELYGYIDNLMVISSYIQKEYPGVLKVSSRLDEKVELGVGTRNDEPLLHDIFEKLVQNLDDPTMQKIYNRWVSTVEEVSWIDRATVWKFLLLITALGMVFVWRYYELKRYNTKLLELSTTDKLTGLYNRQKTDEILIEEWEKLRRYPEYACSVMMIDVDFFKSINDTRGHQTGDNVLQELAGILTNNVRATDIVGRWGGEEFIVILPYTRADEAMNVAERLNTVTISIGAGEFSSTDSVHECIGRIDSALYKAKEDGRNRVYLA
jgi:diguanylate cyclase (GGDEF)-like protein